MQRGGTACVVNPALVGADEAPALEQGLRPQPISRLVEYERGVGGGRERDEAYRETDQHNREDGAADSSGHFAGKVTTP